MDCGRRSTGISTTRRGGARSWTRATGNKPTSARPASPSLRSARGFGLLALTARAQRAELRLQLLERLGAVLAIELFRFGPLVDVRIAERHDAHIGHAAGLQGLEVDHPPHA